MWKEFGRTRLIWGNLESLEYNFFSSLPKQCPNSLEGWHVKCACSEASHFQVFLFPFNSFMMRALSVLCDESEKLGISLQFLPEGHYFWDLGVQLRKRVLVLPAGIPSCVALFHLPSPSVLGLLWPGWRYHGRCSLALEKYQGVDWKPHWMETCHWWLDTRFSEEWAFVINSSF